MSVAEPIFQNRHSRMFLAGIQANFEMAPDQNIRGALKAEVFERLLRRALPISNFTPGAVFTHFRSETC